LLFIIRVVAFYGPRVASLSERAVGCGGTDVIQMYSVPTCVYGTRTEAADSNYWSISSAPQAGIGHVNRSTKFQ